MRVFVMENDALFADHRFGQSPIVVGSGDDCAIKLPDWRLAPQHIRLVPQPGGGWSVEPLQASVPIRINGAAVDGSHPLKDLDEIALGSYVLKVYMTLDGPEPPRRAGAPRREEFLLPLGGFVRNYGGELKVPMERAAEFATQACQLAAEKQINTIAEQILARAVSAFDASAACAVIRQRTATGLDSRWAVDAKRRPIDPPALAGRLYERCTRHLSRICLPDAETPGVQTALATPLVGSRNSVLGMLYVERAAGAPPFDGAALDLLAALAAAAAPAVERALVATATARAEVVDHAQVVGRATQDALTPRALPTWPELDIAAYRRPGAHRARDFYDVLRLANHTAALLVARVEAPGAMLPRLISELRAAYRVSCLHADAPHVFVRAINWLLGDPHAGWAIDAACVWLLPATGALRYCVAGADISLGVIGGRGEPRELEPCGFPPVARQRGFAYVSRPERLDAGETLTLITDGADLLKNPAGAAFGRKRVAECLCDTAGMSVPKMLADLVTELDEFAAGGPTPEDLTVLLAQRSAG